MTEQLGIEGFVARNMAAGLDRVFEELRMEKMLDDDIKCQSLHLFTGKGACTVEVTHRVRMACRGSYLVCAVSAQAERDFVVSGAMHRCGEPIADCITIVPV